MQLIQTIIGGIILASMFWVGDSINTIKVDIAELTTKVDFVIGKRMGDMDERWIYHDVKFEDMEDRVRALEIWRGQADAAPTR
jgi:hypothetical protein